MNPEVVQILDQGVYVAFIKHNESTKEEWCTDYFCLPYNASTQWYTGSDIIHVQVAFKVQLSGGTRCTPEVTYRTFSVDTKRKVVHCYDHKQFSNEFAWEFIRFTLNKTVTRKDGAQIRQVEAAYNFCHEQIGKPARVLGMLAIPLGSWDGGGGSYFCSEYVVQMFHHAGELKNVCPWSTSPAELHSILLGPGYTRTGKAVIYPHLTTWEGKTVSFH